MVAPHLMATTASDIWAPLRAGAEAWHALQFDGEFSVNVGSDQGTLFRWESPGFSSSKTRMAGASLSKWPAAIMISGLVNDGTLHWDDLASKHLSWWTKDPKDPRSRIQLKHLLSFTSGYTTDGSASMRCAEGVAVKDQYMACAESLYDNLGAKHSYEPATTWAYLGCHLQFAGAMAVAASGLEIDHLFERYLYRPFNMTSTTWTPTKNPQLAVGITTTADDFEQMLHRLLTYEVLPKSILDVMETDYSQPPVDPSGDGWFGHYGMGHWWECIGYGTPLCTSGSSCARVASAKIRRGGMFGYRCSTARGGAAGEAAALLLQIALQEPEPLSGIPEYLRIAAKPVDAILSRADRPTRRRSTWRWRCCSATWTTSRRSSRRAPAQRQAAQGRAVRDLASDASRPTSPAWPGELTKRDEGLLLPRSSRCRRNKRVRVHRAQGGGGRGCGARRDGKAA